MPSRLKTAITFLKKKTLRAVSNATHFAKKLGECPGPLPPALVSPKAAFTQWWDTTCEWSWQELELLGSLGINDTERATCVTRSITRGASVVHTLLDFARVLGYKDRWCDEDLRQFVLYYAGLDLTGDLIANLKYHTLVLSNKAKNVDPPVRGANVRSVDGWLLNYAFLRYVKRKANRHDWVSETLLLGLKRGFPTMDLKSVDNELRGLANDLSAAPADLPDEIYEAIRRTAYEIFEVDPVYPVKDNFQISPKAGFEKEAAIKSGGIRGYVWRWAVARNLVNPEIQLDSMKWGPHCGQVIEYRSLLEMKYSLTWRELYTHWKAERDMLGGFSGRRRPTNCRVAVIFEPLKVRPITAGEALRYALGKPMQAYLWRRLQRFPLFQLTGRMVDVYAITQQMSIRYPWEQCKQQRDSESPHPGLTERWFRSGDFKAATNNLNSRATGAILAAIFSPGSEGRDLAEDLVGEHTVHWKPMSEGTKAQRDVAWNSFLQQQGQLMGSMISFPLLCTVNAAMLRLAVERWLRERGDDRHLSLYQIPALINGDDILFRGSRRLDDIWQELCPQVGFYESIGKSYISKEWVQINSRTFDVSCDLAPGMVVATRQRAFLNFGVIEGYEKGVDPQDEPNLEDISIRLSGFWDEFKNLPAGGVRRRAQELSVERLNDRFTAAYRQNYIPYIPSLSNPTWAGGFGLYEAELDVDAANQALSYIYRRPQLGNFLTGEVEGFWERRAWEPLDRDGFLAWRDQKLLERYRD